ncbi:MAG: 4-(cytidine 5'-diphospho)-2-C-methyl-D-erythritol kinase [Methyloceanibacter sp.]
MVMTLSETARAKINLTLQVLGRRDDSYHELLSLVAFVEAGDLVELEPEMPRGLSIDGPFAAALSGDNLILNAAQAAQTFKPEIKLGHFRLVKQLPVAAGLGGGSADAAAALRLIARANGGELGAADRAALAIALGSDVSVCLESRPALITGRGEKVALVQGFPRCAVLLANPRLPLATAPVYAALRAALLSAQPDPVLAPDFGEDFEALVAYLIPRGNDLERPAAGLVPEIREVLASLSGLTGARIARLSGSGPTCFALFATHDEAVRAAATLSRSHPSWWIVPSALG